MTNISLGTLPTHTIPNPEYVCIIVHRYVFALQASQEERQGTSHLEYRREPASGWWARSAAACALLGEINDCQELAWRKSIELFPGQDGPARPISAALFAEDRAVGAAVGPEQMIKLRLGELQLCRPRQWGGCWLALHLWGELGLDSFWAERLPASRKGTRWDQVLAVLTIYRLLSSGSEWRLHREWFLRQCTGGFIGWRFFPG